MTTFGYTTFCTADWTPLTEIMLNSFLENSKYDITVNCINFEWKINHPRIKCKTLFVEKLDRMNLFKQKWVSALNCEYDVSLLIESDMIASKDVDAIYEKNINRLLGSKFPLFCKHPNNPFSPITSPGGWDLRNFVSGFCEEKPKMNYVYANCLFHRDNNRWLFEELIYWLDYYLSKNTHIPCEDEGVLNALLVKYQLDYDIGFDYLPNTMLIDDFIQNDFKPDSQLYEIFLKRDSVINFEILQNCKDAHSKREMIQKLQSDLPVQFGIFHGCKDPIEAHRMLGKLMTYYDTHQVVGSTIV